jgi:hypothetical protein
MDDASQKYYFLTGNPVSLVPFVIMRIWTKVLLILMAVLLPMIIAAGAAGG